MKKTSGLSLLIACAVLLAACGSKDKETESQPMPEQIVIQPEETETDSKESEEPQAEEDKDKSQSNTDQKQQEKTAQPKQNSQTNKGTSQPATSTPSSGSGASQTAKAPASNQPAVASKQEGAAGNINLWVSRYFAAETEFDKTVSFKKDQKLLDVMQDHLEVETAYGGGFVNGINGTKSGYTDKSVFTRKKRDWFYFVNGSVADVGADQFAVRSGDTVWWDYHDWTGNGSNALAVVGSYPHPFTLGYDGTKKSTVVMYWGAHQPEADRLVQGLKNKGADARAQKYNGDAIFTFTGNLVLLGTWDEVAPVADVQELMTHPRDYGIYASFADGQVQALNYQGKPSGTAGQGAILATGNQSGDSTPVWMVLGATEAGLDQAVDVMVSNGGKLRGKVGAVVNGGDVIGVPVER